MPLPFFFFLIEICQTHYPLLSPQHISQLLY